MDTSGKLAIPIPGEIAGSENAPLFPSPKIALRYLWHDAGNPLYAINFETAPRFAKRWKHLFARTARTALLFGALAYVVALFGYFRELPPATHARINAWIAFAFTLPFFFSFLIPIARIRLTFYRFVHSRKLESLLLTQLTNEELMRGIAVPQIRHSAPWVLLPALAFIVWPLSIEGYDLTKRILISTFYLSIATNVYAMTWIGFGFLVNGAGLRSLTIMAVGLFVLDPFMLTWEAGLLNMNHSWRPLIFAFAMLELLYIAVRLTWAYLVIRDLKDNFRICLTR